MSDEELYGQTKWSSFRESITNISIGYVIATISQILIFPLYGIHVSIFDNLTMGLFFTVVSIIRSYLLRRYFNKKNIQRIKKMI